MGADHYDGRVTNPARRVRPGPGALVRLVVCALAMLLGGSLTVAVAAPTQAAVDPDVAVRITGVSPTELRDGATVTLTGTITNRGKERWTKAQAYLVIARTPFTTRQQVSDAVESQASYTGERVVELDSIDEVGTLAPGSTRPFRVRVPYAQLRVSGAEGVYPVGIQVLATAEDGTRDNAAIARATTFLPRLDRDSTRVPGGLVWPFVLPDRLGPSGTWMDAPGLAERVAPGGQLRNLLDQALSAPSDGTSLVLDPALLVAVDDLAEGRRLPRDVRLDETQREAARTFVEDLTGLSRRVATWTLGYARPDWLALSRSDAHDRLSSTIERATSSALAQFQVSGRRVTWPTRGGTTSELIEQVRGSGDRPVIVTRDAVPDWEPRLGSVVTRRTESGPVPLFVDAGLDVGVPGGATVATLRQRLLSEAALASLERSADAESKADAFVLVDPRWNPGDTDDDAFAGAFDPDFVSPEDLEDLMTTRRDAYTGEVTRTAEARPLSQAQVTAVEQLAREGGVLAGLAVEGDDLAARTDRTSTGLLSTAWRTDRAEGLRAATGALGRVRAELGRLAVEGPPAITLSSAEGSFPLTVSNDTDTAVRVGVRISASNPALRIPDVAPVQVEAGERRTVTVQVDVGDQTSSTLTAQLISPDGTAVGRADSFNVRSSRVGVALWALMGAAGLFVLFALGRRFLRGRRAAATTPEETPTDG